MDILRVNEIILYFVYGQVFFSLGIVIALHSRKHSRLPLARHLRWLAAFGLVHGLNEWGHIFIPIQATYVPNDVTAALEATHTLLLAASFYLLFQFGLKVALVRPRGSVVYAVPAGILLLWLVVPAVLAATSTGSFVEALKLPAVKSSARLMLGFTGASVASFGMFRQARWLDESGWRHIAGYFRWTAVCMAAYAIVAGLFLHAGVWITSQLGGLSPIVDFVTLPAPVFRSIAGIGVAFGVIRGLGIFELETGRLLEEAKQDQLRAADRARMALEATATTLSKRVRKDSLLGIALEKVLEIIGASAGWAMLVRPNDGALEIWASKGAHNPVTPGTLCAGVEDCFCRRVVADANWGPADSSSLCVMWSESEMPRPFVSTPLQAQDRTIGILNIAGQSYGPEELGLLASMGKQIGLAMENADLWHELERKEEMRAQLLARVIAAQEDERKRVARELHDETGQKLIAVIMGLGAASEALSLGAAKGASMVDDTREIAVEVLDGIRQLILGLRPTVLDDLGLAPALRRLAEDLCRRSSVSIQVTSDGLDKRLPPDVETVLFRILQEGMNNIVRHSHATRALLCLTCNGSSVSASLEDDGVGFDPASAIAFTENGRGLGLVGMRERASLLGGEVTIDSSPGRGARLGVRLPLVERV
ncbi:MAG: GAF domain-containing sensor histidine kinase [Dehalococcoidia bacterium]|nr:GAF domain-containing sensor histidine kinase [Dehalococcoidia bacterium]